MTTEGKRTHRIRRPEEIAALTSPVRQEIVDVLCVAGPRTAAELGGLLGRAPDSLYYHLRKLAATGLLIERTREVDENGGRRTESVYETCAPRMLLDWDRNDSEVSQKIEKTARALLRAAERDFQDFLRSGQTLGKGARRRAGFGRVKGWLSAGDLEKVNGLLDEIAEVYLSGNPRPGTKLHSFSFVVSPVEPNPRAPE